MQVLTRLPYSTPTALLLITASSPVPWEPYATTKWRPCYIDFNTSRNTLAVTYLGDCYFVAPHAFRNLHYCSLFHDQSFYITYRQAAALELSHPHGQQHHHPERNHFAEEHASTVSFFFSNLSIFSGTFKKEKDHFFHFFRSVIHLLKENLISNRFDSFSACKSDSQICCPFRHLLRATGVFVEHGGMTVVADSLVRKINVSKNITLPLNKPVSTAFKSSTNSAFTSTTSSW